MRLWSAVHAQGTYAFRTDAKAPSLAGSARAITHLIPEVRPLPVQRVALFKNAPGVFIRAARCFSTGVCSHHYKCVSFLGLRSGLFGWLWGFVR